jgi:uncharacterized protein YjiS (DUF1127 family)
MPDERDIDTLIRNFWTLPPGERQALQERLIKEAKDMRAQAIHDLTRQFWAWLTRRNAAARLRTLDDRLLKDIGLHRSEIEAAVRGDRTFPRRAPARN